MFRSTKNRNSESSEDQAQVAMLRSKLVDSWSVQEVAIWLGQIGLSAYRKVFIENEIAGSELADLTESELTSIGITKLGHRKRLLTKIQEIMDSGGDWETSSSAGSDHSSSSSQSSSVYLMPSRKSSCVSAQSNEESPHTDKVVVKLRYKKKIRVISVEPDVRMDALKRMVKKEFHQRMKLFFKDADGDVFEIKRTSHLKAAITQYLRSNANSMNIICKSKKSLNDDTYNTKLDGVVHTEEDGTIYDVNSAFCHLWGYKKEELIGKPCTILMPSDMADKHSNFMQRYIQSGVPHILGRGRPVVGVKRDGSLFTVYLILTETAVEGKRRFSATFSPVQKNEASAKKKSSAPELKKSFFMLENLLDPCIVINETGEILFANKATTESLGYTVESLVGSNVKTIVPPGPHRDNHDRYLSNYMQTRKGKIIGIGREEKALHKDGRLIPVQLSMSETRIDANHSLFTGVLRILEESDHEDSEEMRVKELAREIEVVGRLAVPGIIINSTGKILTANKAACKMYGYNEESLVGQNCRMLMPEPESSMHDDYLLSYCNAAKRGHSNVVGMGREVISKHRNGRLLPVHISVSEFTLRGQFYFTAILQKK